MKSEKGNRWLEDNQRYLSAELAHVRALLHKRCPDAEEESARESPGSGPKPLEEIAVDMTAPPALERLSSIFGLSAFERQVLLLCAGIELDGAFAGLCSSCQGDGQRPFATFSLALAAFPDAHWNALSPAAPLRFWRLVEVEKRDSLASSPLRIDERILHYLTGVFHLDERLWGLVRPCPPPAPLVPSQQKLSDRILRAWSRTKTSGAWPVIELHGKDKNSRRDIAATASRALGFDLYILPVPSLPSDPADLEAVLRLWRREAALSSFALLLEYEDAEASDPVRASWLESIVDRTGGAVFISGRERRKLGERSGLDFEVVKPSLAEQRDLWAAVFKRSNGEADGSIDAVVAQFNFDSRTIYSAGAEALTNLNGDDRSRQVETPFGVAVWDVCRRQARPKLDDLAQRLEPAVNWDDLILPDLEIGALKTIAAQLRQRVRVYEEWGFAARSARGLGISALFAGESGTGKTLAAEVLSGDLRLDLYRIDLSQVVSKYIGETEKNLRRVFDAAEDGGAILLFDEADALFGKRSEVKDSHDRYANIEVSYLLQRMEAYRGLAILTTNLKSALDSAFLRRLRFVVQFPFPDADRRAAIWRRMFPSQTPTDGLRYEKLARLNVAGGNIRNIALNAAFLAADEGLPVRMSHVLRAART
ncbi:MAG: ATP-binding protein, partial [Candidatus Aminicenantes bacterium]|nr:ATP-binding protein [Candidatus Aminicenantes bacterium]